MTAYSPTQDGYLIVATGLWRSVSDTLFVEGTSGPAGLIFDLGTSDGASVASISLALREVARLDALYTFSTWNLYLSSDPTPALWSDGNPPTTAGATLVSSIYSESYAVGSALSFAFDMAAASPTLTDPSWAGKIALVLEFSPSGGILFSSFHSSRSASVPDRPLLTATIPAAPDLIGGGGRLQNPKPRRRQPHPRLRIRTGSP